MSKKPFNQKNFFGRHCVWAMIPGWSDFDFSSADSTTSAPKLGVLESVGQRMEFADSEATSDASATVSIVSGDYGHLGKLRALQMSPVSNTSFVNFRRGDADEGIIFPDPQNLTILAIVRTAGLNQPGGGDPRIFSKDVGTGEADHDLMIGLAAAGVNARCRVRIGSATRTIIPNAVEVQNNALNLIAGGVFRDAGAPSNSTGWCAILREDGGYDDTSTGAVVGAYNPRTTAAMAIGATANTVSNQNAFEGDIIGVWAFDTAFYGVGETKKTLLKEFFLNPWQVFAPQKIFVPIPAYKETSVTAEDIGPGIVTGEIVFGLEVDKQPTFALTAEAAATFLVNLTMLQTADTGSVEGLMTFGLTATQLNTNVADRPVSFSATLDLSQLESNVATKVEAALFALEADQSQTNTKLVDGILTFSTEMDYSVLNQLIANADATIAADLSYSVLNQMVADKSVNFGTVLDQAQINQLVATATATFGTVLDYNAIFGAIVTGAVTFGTTLDYTLLNQLIAEASTTFNVEMDQTELNRLIAQATINLNTELDYTLLNQLIGNLTITLGTDLDFLGVGDGAGEISAAISFIVQAQQEQTKVLTGDRAITFLMNAATQYNTQLDKDEALSLVLQASDQYAASRGVNESITIAADMDQTQSNTLDKVLLMSFNSLMDKNFNTAGSVFGSTISFATRLATQFGTEGDVSALITFSTDMGLTEQTNKITDMSMGFNVDASIITEIHLIVDGQMAFTSTMDQTEAKQLLGQSGITFGHIQGLASLGSADFGADISFGTIQNAQVNGFILQFEIITPSGRTYKIYMEDRTVEVSDGSRISNVNKT